MPSSAHIEGWFRRLQDDRLEIYLKVDRTAGVQPRKIRASGPEAEMNELADWFEQKAGLRVAAPWRTVKANPIPGQIELDMSEAVHTPGDDPTTPDAEFFDRGNIDGEGHKPGLSSDATLVGNG